MTNPADLVALPHGGGAQSGLGESFAPDLFTGTGNFTIPIAVPEGRNGLQPSLNLVYSTGHGNGVFGLGWSLNLARIVRKVSDGVPRYDDEQDRFLLSSTNDELVPVAGSFPGIVRYQPRTEGLFARIDFHRDAENSFWEVRTRNGLRSLYGSPTSGPAVIRDPHASNPTAGIFAWLLQETSDPYGNRIVYDYETELDASGGHDGTQTYLRSIRYVETPGAGAEGFLVSVDFDYGDPAAGRPDPFSSYRAGFETRTLRRCRGITISTHLDGAIPSRRYEFTYLDQLVTAGEWPEESLPVSGLSLLARIRATGIARPGAGEDQSLPAIDFDYSAYRPQERRFHPVTGRALPASTLSSPSLELIDLNGSGLPDFLETEGAYRYWRNLGGGQFDLPRPMSEAPAGVTLGTAGVSALDINGDGRVELMVADPLLAGYYSLNSNGLFDRQGFRRIDRAPSFNAADPELRFIDLDGDGVTDAVRAGADFECFFADPGRGWEQTIRRPRGVPGSFPDVHFGDHRVHTADMTGDGLMDIVLVHDRNVEYWPNLGHGRWGGRISMRDAPLLPAGYLPRQVMFGDLDGDGVDDLVFIGQSKVLIWFNRSGNSWSAPVEIGGTPRFTNASDVRLVDLLGVGTAGILWADPTGRGGRADFRFLDLTGGIKPYLLTRMDNNSGAVTEVHYRSSCLDYVRDSRRRETRWQTTLPVPVQVVGSVSVTDHFSGNRLVSEYEYRHGHYDGEEKSFVGFGRVTVRDAVFDADAATPPPFEGFSTFRRTPPIERRSWFDLGPVGPGHGDWREIHFDGEFWPGDPPGLGRFREQRAALLADLTSRHHRRDALRAMRGAILREEVRALDGTPDAAAPYTVTEQVRLFRPERLPTTSVERPIFFTFDAAGRTTQWDRGDDPQTRIQVFGDFDAFGQQRRQVVIGCPRRWEGFAQPRDDLIATMTVTAFAQPGDPDRFIVDRPATIEFFELLSTLNGAPVLAEDLALEALSGEAATILHGSKRHYYDGAAFVGLPLGSVGEFGARVRDETMVLTSGLLDEALETDALPPYLDPATPAIWPDVYPVSFQSAAGPRASYILEATSSGTAYFAPTDRRAYDFQQTLATNAVGLVTGVMDPRGHETRITYDSARLFAARIEGPTGLPLETGYDYHALQPALVVDHNGNRTAYTYTPLGLLDSVAVMGREGTLTSDTPATPSKRYLYDLLAFEQSPPEARRPVSVTTVQRHFHVNGPFDEAEPAGRVTRLAEYSDGFGRLLQSRTDAEPTAYDDDPAGAGNGLPIDQALPAEAAIPTTIPDRVRVSGAVTYDEKGRAIELFAHYFDTGLGFAPPAVQHLGRRTQHFYDPVGRLVRTRLPDGAESWTVLGIPASLEAPSGFAPTPWECFTYDANDLASLSQSPEDGQSLADAAPDGHAFTPSSVEVDAFGRIIRLVRRLGPAANDELITRTRYDIRGNPLEVTDPLGRIAFRYRYDLLNRPLVSEAIDNGRSVSFADAAGLSLEQRDGKGALVLTASDPLGRPTAVWTRDRAGLPIVQRELRFYGDTAPSALLSPGEALSRNLLGQLFQHYDGAGRLTAIRYDFKGTPLETAREVFSDSVLLSAFDGPVEDFQVDWTVPPGSTLQNLAETCLSPVIYRTTTVHDALGRPISVDYPEDVEGQRRRLHLSYANSGAVDSLALDGIPIVRHTAYDARGQRALIAYGNGVMTRYAYDPQSLRLRRLRSERFLETGPFHFQPQGPPSQDFAYRYDLAGNLLQLTDRTPESGILNNPEAAMEPDQALAQLLIAGDALIGRFAYDPLYRLTEASGREHDQPVMDPPWRDEPRTRDFTLTRPYQERYRYDVLGNMEEVRHLAGPAGTFTKTFSLQPGATPGIASNNRLQRLSVAGADFDYVHDAAGNLLSEETTRSFHWSAGNDLKGFQVRAGIGPPSLAALYLYAADGSRVKSIVRSQGGGVRTVTTIGAFERARENGVENDTLDIADGPSRIASIRIGAAFQDDTTPARKYYLPDHLGSANLVLDSDAFFVDREETLPYGSTSFGSFARKRWRFTGRGRDRETGLSRHGARYYAPWLGRWISADPLAARFPDWSAYAYSLCRPTSLKDLSGLAPTEEQLAMSTSAIETRVQDLGTEVSQLEDLVRDAETNVDEMVKRHGKGKGVIDWLDRKILGVSKIAEIQELREIADRLEDASTRLSRIETELSDLDEVLTKRAKDLGTGFRGARLEEKVLEKAKWLKRAASAGLTRVGLYLDVLRKVLPPTPPGWGGRGGGGAPPALGPGAGAETRGLLSSGARLLRSGGNLAAKYAGPIGYAIEAADVGWQTYEAPEGQRGRTAFTATARKVGETGGVFIGSGLGWIAGALSPVPGGSGIGLTYGGKKGSEVVGEVASTVVGSVYDLLIE